MDFLPDEKIGCPYTGFTKKCRTMVVDHACPKFVKLDGVNPQTGEPMSRFGCIDAFQAHLQLENSAQQRSTAAEVEALRKKFVDAASMILLAAGGSHEQVAELQRDTRPVKLLSVG